MKTIIKKTSLLVAVAMYLAMLIFLISLTKANTVWFGFVILWYWGMVAKAKLRPIYAEILPGVLFGILCVYLIHMFDSYALLAIAIPVSLLICSINKWLPVLINRSTFLALTVLTIPDLHLDAITYDLFAVTVVTIFYIAITAYAKEQFTKKKELAAN